MLEDRLAPATFNVTTTLDAVSALDRAALALGTSTATAYRHWAFARAWLSTELRKDA